MVKAIKTWYKTTLPTGEITTLTLEETKAVVDDYLTGECDEYNHENYQLFQRDAVIYQYNSNGKVAPVCERKFHWNFEVDDIAEYKDNIDINYGILGFFTKWEDIK